jgi:DNA transformation protein and related proteins
MAVSQSFQSFILDLLGPLEPVARRMFGGVGLFHNGVMFGLLAGDTVHFRVSGATIERYKAAGSGPFTYMRGDRRVAIGAYYVVPEGLMDRPEDLLEWAREAIIAARPVQQARNDLARRETNGETPSIGARRPSKRRR